MTLLFLAAIERLPLGTTVAIEFLGPLTVAGVRSRSRRALVWPLLALLGVLALTEPWKGDVDVLGLLFAALAGTGWGIYIALTQHVGGRPLRRDRRPGHLDPGGRGRDGLLRICILGGLTLAWSRSRPCSRCSCR